eukprot:gnl/TRDRNA2_/TRDRNA2_86975_c1_seq1.p3 gnl/TRDRNA2_/TRDRNA2_86975_c1~~gnl/TRDRNA2_/TRDRNA2_86975_c1_seq1.p3  ORF type:complete len:108 (-),score=15.79 gnl/TRDRNA2_/TRDRNA2_86975_c1_seq1:99-422(-)
MRCFCQPSRRKFIRLRLVPTLKSLINGHVRFSISLLFFFSISSSCLSVSLFFLFFSFVSFAFFSSFSFAFVLFFCFSFNSFSAVFLLLPITICTILLSFPLQHQVPH